MPGVLQCGTEYLVSSFCHIFSLAETFISVACRQCQSEVYVLDIIQITKAKIYRPISLTGLLKQIVMRYVTVKESITIISHVPKPKHTRKLNSNSSSHCGYCILRM